MSDPGGPSAAAPAEAQRRTGRTRKQVEPYVTGNSTNGAGGRKGGKGKGKKAARAADEDDDAGAASDSSDLSDLPSLNNRPPNPSKPSKPSKPITKTNPAAAGPAASDSDDLTEEESDEEQEDQELQDEEEEEEGEEEDEEEEEFRPPGAAKSKAQAKGKGKGKKNPATTTGGKKKSNTIGTGTGAGAGKGKEKGKGKSNARGAANASGSGDESPTAARPRPIKRRKVDTAKTPAAAKSNGQNKGKEKATATLTATTTRGRGGGGGREVDGDEEGEGGIIRRNGRGELRVGEDNGLFNALIDPQASIHNTVEEWLVNFNQSGGGAGDDGGEGEEEEKRCLGELVGFLFRCCGLSNIIDPDMAGDLDAVTSMIDDVQTELNAAGNMPTFPLTTRDKHLKPLQTRLPKFLITFIDQLSNTPLLYLTATSPPPPSGPSTPLLQLLLTWLNPMTSSPFRALRHTATFITMWIGVGIAEVGKKVRAGVGVAERGKEVRALEQQIEEGEGRLEVLDEYFRDIFDGVFVHRYRDKDALIRADCLTILGHIIKAYPDKFIATNYLQYVDWSLTDTDHHARLEAVKVLTPVYADENRIPSVRNFTSRAIPRLIEMAILDINSSIRVETIKVLITLDRAGFLGDLDEEKKETLGCLLFDKDARVRKAVAGMVGDWYVERRDELLAQAGLSVKQKKTGRKGGKGRRRRDEDGDEDMDGSSDLDGDDDAAAEQTGDDKEIAFVSFKALASLLLGLSHRLDRIAKGTKTQDNFESQSQTQRAQLQRERDMLASLSTTTSALTTHASIAAQTLWEDVDLLKEWNTLISLLIEDQSKAKEDEKHWALEGDEETFLLDLLHDIVKRHIESEKSKKTTGEDNAQQAESRISQTLIESLPKLFAKYQSDGLRIADVMRLAGDIKVDMYSEQRLEPAYKSLWDDIIRQYLRHSDMLVLDETIKVVSSMEKVEALRAVNEAKAAELSNSLFESLNQVLVDKDLAVASFEDEELQLLESALLRLSRWAARHDLREQFKPGDEGSTDFYAIVVTLANRGRLGYREEIQVVKHAMQLLFIILTWTMRQQSLADVDDVDNPARSTIERQRDEALQVYQTLAVDSSTNAAESVKRDAVGYLLRTYMLFRPVSQNPGDGDIAPSRKTLSLEMDDSIQFRLAGTIQHAIDQYRETTLGFTDNASDASSDLTEDEDDRVASRDISKADAIAATPEGAIAAKEFQKFIWIFIHAIRCRIIDAQHASVFLSYCGRVDSFFDKSLEQIVDALQEEGIYNKDEYMVTQVIGQSLRDSFGHYLDFTSCKDEPTATIDLAKHVSRAFFVHKAHFQIERQLDAQVVGDFHQDCITWVLNKASAFYKQMKANKVKKAQERFKLKTMASLRFFRALILLLPAVKGREALRTKAHLDETLQSLDLKPGKGPIWDALLAYDKKLVSAASSDKKIAAASKKQTANKTTKAAEQPNEDERPAKRVRRSANEANALSAEVVNNSDEEPETRAEEPGSKASGVTETAPQPRRRPPPKRRAPASGDEDTVEPVAEPTQEAATANATNKRRRDAVEEVTSDAEEEEEEENIEPPVKRARNR